MNHKDLDLDLDFKDLDLHVHVCNISFTDITLI